MTVRYVPADKTLKDTQGRDINLDRLLKINGLAMELSVCAAGDGRWEFELSYNNPRGHTVASCSFDINLENKILFIEEMNSDGYGSVGFSKLLNLVDKLDVRRVELKATEVGGYFFGRIGLLPKKHEITQLEAYASRKLQERVFLTSPQDFRNLVISLDGKRALVDSAWMGYLDLDDWQQMAFCREYLGLKLNNGHVV